MSLNRQASWLIVGFVCIVLTSSSLLIAPAEAHYKNTGCSNYIATNWWRGDRQGILTDEIVAGRIDADTYVYNRYHTSSACSTGSGAWAESGTELYRLVNNVWVQCDWDYWNPNPPLGSSITFADCNNLYGVNGHLSYHRARVWIVGNPYDNVKTQTIPT